MPELAPVDEFWTRAGPSTTASAMVTARVVGIPSEEAHRGALITKRASLGGAGTLPRKLSKYLGLRFGRDLRLDSPRMKSKWNIQALPIRSRTCWDSVQTDLVRP